MIFFLFSLFIFHFISHLQEAALIAIGKIIKQYITIFPAEFKNPLITGTLELTRLEWQN